MLDCCQTVRTMSCSRCSPSFLHWHICSILLTCIGSLPYFGSLHNLCAAQFSHFLTKSPPPHYHCYCWKPTCNVILVATAFPQNPMEVCANVGVHKPSSNIIQKATATRIYLYKQATALKGRMNPTKYQYVLVVKLAR